MLRSRRKNTDRTGILYTAGTALVLFASMTVLFTGCGAAREQFDNIQIAEGDAYSTSYDVGGSSWEAESAATADTAVNSGEGSDNGAYREGRKLIETVSLEVETREFEQMMSVLEERIQELDGYVEAMDTYNGSSYSGYNSNRSAHLTVRIPSGKLDGFLDTVSDIGNIVRRHNNVEDVTLSYVDMESRRNTLRTEQSRLLEFLDKAETIEEIITIEQRLSEVRYQLESMESQLRTIDNLVDYSTVDIDISEVKELTPVEEPSAWERISEGFAENLISIGHGTVELGIWFLVNLPYLAVWGAVLTAVIFAVRRHHRKRKKRLEEQLKKAAPTEIPVE